MDSLNKYLEKLVDLWDGIPVPYRYAMMGAFAGFLVGLIF